MFRVIASARVWIASLLAAALMFGAAVSAGPASAASTPKPTVVLVHGSFTDASSWSRVIPGLQQRGYPVIAEANPLRGIATDSAYLKNLLAQIKGPVVLVGHSYGGIVISNAAIGNPNVKALVFVAAFAPAEGETGNQLIAHAPGSILSPAALDVRTYVTPDGRLAPEVTAKPDKLRPIFAADLPSSLTKIAAASQRPAALSTLSDSVRPAGLGDDPLVGAGRRCRQGDRGRQRAVHGQAHPRDHSRGQGRLAPRHALPARKGREADRGRGGRPPLSPRSAKRRARTEPAASARPAQCPEGAAKLLREQLRLLPGGEVPAFADPR